MLNVKDDQPKFEDPHESEHRKLQSDKQNNSRRFKSNSKNFQEKEGQSTILWNFLSQLSLLSSSTTATIARCSL